MRRCLGSLAGQGADQIVVVHSSDAEFTRAIVSEFPQVQWIVHAGAAELPTLQWLALAQVQSEIAAFLEAPSVAAPDWVAAHRRAHQEQPDILACGGPVRPPEQAAAWAKGWHWSDYASYAPGRASGMTTDLSDANVSYKTQQLRTHEWLMQQGAWGWRIRKTAAARSYFESSASIDYPCPYPLRDALRQRHAAGAAHRPATSVGLGRRVAAVVAAPLLPALLTWRGWTAARGAGAGMPYALALPWILIFHAYWTCGELAGPRQVY